MDAKVIKKVHVFKSESNGPVHFFLGQLLTVTDVSTTCAVVIFRVKASCITSELLTVVDQLFPSL